MLSNLDSFTQRSTQFANYTKFEEQNVLIKIFLQKIFRQFGNYFGQSVMLIFNWGISVQAFTKEMKEASQYTVMRFQRF